MRKFIFILIFIFLSTCFTATASAIDVPIGDIGSYSLDSAGTTYNLTGDVSSTSDQFLVYADNVILDGKNYQTGKCYNVTYGTVTASSNGVWCFGHNNITIKNINFIQPSTNANSHTIKIVGGSSNVTVSNITANQSGDGAICYVLNCNSITLDKVSGYSAGWGIWDEVSTVSVSNCNTTSLKFGLYLASDTTGTFNNSIFNASSSEAVYIYSSSGLNLNNVSGIASSNTAFGFDSSSHITINDCTGQSTAGIGIILNGATIEYINITDSEFSSGSNYGLYLVNASNIIFSNTKFGSDSNIAIFIYNSLNDEFSNITIDDPYSSAPHASNHILCEGDSITHGGNGIIGGYGTYLNQTLNIGSTWYVSNRGQSGDTAEEAKTRFGYDLDIYNPTVSCIMLGTNDLGIGRTESDIIKDVLDLANISKAHGTETYILLTPSVMDDTTRISYDTNLAIQAQLLGFKTINVYDTIDSIPLNGQYDEFNGTNYVVDGWHPTEAGNELIGSYVGTQILTTLPADFRSSSVSGTAPLTVQFSDISSSATMWYWDFENDGIVDSIKQNPVHTYGKAGTYSVNLIVRNDYDNNVSKLKTDYITVSSLGVIDTVSKLYWWLKGYFGWM